jgi:hypothetical protein
MENQRANIMSSQKNEEPASHILIRPSAAHYADQMADLTNIVYDLDPDERGDWFNADHFRHHVTVYPEGQFIAIDTRTDRVVGLTSCVRTVYDPNRPPRQTWWAATGYG